MDPFVVGLAAGAVVGFAGLSLRLAQLAALVGAAGLAWIMIERGPAGLEPMLNQALDFLKPHGRLIAGALIGAVLGNALRGQLRSRATH